MDISVLFSYLRSTSNLALTCRGFAWRVRSNGFPIRTSMGELCLKNFPLYKSLGFPDLDKWINDEFYILISENNPGRLQLLLQQGADPETRDKWGKTVLIWAAVYGRTECLNVLLQRGADIEAKSNCGNTALIMAASCGKTDCLQLLLLHKADLEPKDNHGSTALVCAAEYGQTDCLRVLLQSGAKVSPELRERFMVEFYSLSHFGDRN